MNEFALAAQEYARARKNNELERAKTATASVQSSIPANRNIPENRIPQTFKQRTKSQGKRAKKNKTWCYVGPGVKFGRWTVLTDPFNKPGNRSWTKAWVMVRCEGCKREMERRLDNIKVGKGRGCMRCAHIMLPDESTEE